MLLIVRLIQSHFSTVSWPISRKPVLTHDTGSFQVCAELEDEKRKHAQDTAQGDDVTYMLEKERERLKQEVN